MRLQDETARWEAGYLSREALIASYAAKERNPAEPFEKNLERNFKNSGAATSFRTARPNSPS